MKIVVGQITGKGRRIAIVVSRFNEFVTKRLLYGCLKELSKQGVPSRNITVAWVSGALEIPIVAQRFAVKKNIDAVICLGAVIRGETFHFELVAYGAAQGITQVSLKAGKPVIFGVLSTDTVKQALQRSDTKGDDKGRDAAVTALEMISLLAKSK